MVVLSFSKCFLDLKLCPPWLKTWMTWLEIQWFNSKLKTFEDWELSQVESLPTYSWQELYLNKFFLLDRQNFERIHPCITGSINLWSWEEKIKINKIINLSQVKTISYIWILLISTSKDCTSGCTIKGLRRCPFHTNLGSAWQEN